MARNLKSNLSYFSMLFTACFCCHTALYAEDPEIFSRTVIVTSPNAEIKTKSSTLNRVNPGEVIVITQANEEWRWVPLLGGWIKENNLKPPSELIELLNQSIKAKPTAERYQLRGIAYQVLQEYEKALADFEASLKLNQRNARLYVNRGNIYRLQQKYQQALSDLNHAIQMDRNSANAFHIRGLINFEMEKTQQAIDDYSESIRLNNKFVSAINARGIAYRKQNRLDLALKDFNQAIKDNSFISEVFSNRAAIWEEKQQFETAVKDYQRALELNPSSATAHNDLAWLYVTCSDASFRDPQAGVKHAIKACELTQFEDWNLLDTLSTAYLENKQTEKAIDSLKKCIDKAPVKEKNILQKKLLNLEDMSK